MDIFSTKMREHDSEKQQQQKNRPNVAYKYATIYSAATYL